jgi:manganese-dependent ADP-ribose/CDP-alcohol diphosphatase
MSNSAMLFSFGLVSDVQYADIPDAVSFHGCPRFYRNSLIGLRRAVEGWREQNVNFAFHLGDILDGYQPKVHASRTPTLAADYQLLHNVGAEPVIDALLLLLVFVQQEHSEAALDAVLAEFLRLGQPVYHMLGNHCLYNLRRPVLNAK